jgi:hypothetical protein
MGKPSALPHGWVPRWLREIIRVASAHARNVELKPALLGEMRGMSDQLYHD